MNDFKRNYKTSRRFSTKGKIVCVCGCVCVCVCERERERERERYETRHGKDISVTTENACPESLVVRLSALIN